MSKTFTYYLWGHWTDRLLLLCCVLGISYFWVAMSHGQTQLSVSIFHDQQLIAWYPLPQNKIIILNLEGHMGVSRLQIDQSHVRFLSSPCKNQYCVAQAAKHSSGQVVACVPNHLMFLIDGESSLDAILE